MSASSAVMKTGSRTRSLAFCGLTIALLAVSAWIVVPFGPVPFTLQTFVVVFALIALTPRQALASICGYLALGAIGLPVFSSMRGGIGVLAGPTGGFLWGFLVGAIVALGFLSLMRKASLYRAEAGDPSSMGRRDFAFAFAAGVLFLAVLYLCGWAQLMAVASLDPMAAFAAAVAPFVILDLVKMAVAVSVAFAVKRAVR